MPTPRKIAFKTLGCRLNQFETDALAAQFGRHGYQIVDFADDADICIVNTCTVTNQGDAKSRKAIHQAVRRAGKPVTIVTGCMVDAQRESLLSEDGVSYFIDNARKTSIFQLVDAHFKGETVAPESFGRDLFGFESADNTFHTRSYIKIQDGCDNFCTYCIVPKVRGRAVSRPAKKILENIREVVDFGFREIVLTGVNIGRYEYEGIDFENLLEMILGLPGEFRVRISSIEPEGFGDKLFGLFQHPRLTPHLHLCLQSGSEKILLQMRRFHTVASFMNIVDRVKHRYPDFNFTTDIIVGFPGETEEDFTMTCNVVQEAGFSHIHTFKYSLREGTRAARMAERVHERVKNERSAIIRSLSDRNKLTYRSSLLGKEQTVLVEKYNPRLKLAKGYGEHYVPVQFHTENQCYNQFARVTLTSLSAGTDPILFAQIVL